MAKTEDRICQCVQRGEFIDSYGCPQHGSVMTATINLDHPLIKKAINDEVIRARIEGAKLYNDELVRKLTVRGLHFENYPVDGLSKAMQEVMTEIKQRQE